VWGHTQKREDRDKIKQQTRIRRDPTTYKVEKVILYGKVKVMVCV